MPELSLPAGTHLAYTVEHGNWWWRLQPQAQRHRGVTVMAAADHGGGIVWEFSIREHMLGRPMPGLQIAVFQDAWTAFADLTPFFTALATGTVRSLSDVCHLLDQLGAVDNTQPVNPATAH